MAVGCPFIFSFITISPIGKQKFSRFFIHVEPFKIQTFDKLQYIMLNSFLSCSRVPWVLFKTLKLRHETSRTDAAHNL